MAASGQISNITTLFSGRPRFVHGGNLYAGFSHLVTYGELDLAEAKSDSLLPFGALHSAPTS